MVSPVLNKELIAESEECSPNTRQSL